MTEAARAYTDKDRRDFGLMAGALLGLAALRSWRHGGRAWPALAAGAALAALAAAAAPAALAPFLAAWMRAARVLSAVNSTILMALLYAAVFAPYGLARRLLGKDPLGARPSPSGSYWRRRGPGRDKADYTRQF